MASSISDFVEQSPARSGFESHEILCCLVHRFVIVLVIRYHKKISGEVYS